MDGGCCFDAESWVVTVFCTNADWYRREDHLTLLCSRGFAVI